MATGDASGHVSVPSLGTVAHGQHTGVYAPAYQQVQHVQAPPSAASSGLESTGSAQRGMAVSLPRQRTAIACRYCRRRKVSDFELKRSQKVV